MKHIVTKGIHTPKTENDDWWRWEDNLDFHDIIRNYKIIDGQWNLIYLFKARFNKTTNNFEREGNHVIFDFDPIDSDHIKDKLPEIKEAIKEIIWVPEDKLTIIFTGRGYHVMFKTAYTFNDRNINGYKRGYNKICDQLQEKLTEHGVKVDPIFSNHGVFVRTKIPGRRSIKKDVNRNHELIQVAIGDEPFVIPFLDVHTIEENEREKEPPQIAKPEKILEGCHFLSHAKARPNDLLEPDWVMLGQILLALPNGRELMHEYSKGHKTYNAKDTDDKCDHIEKKEYRVPKCETINEKWGGCEGCPHWKTKIRNPIQLGTEYQESGIFEHWRIKKEIKNKQGEVIDFYYDTKLDPIKVSDYLNSLKTLYKVDMGVCQYNEESGIWGDIILQKESVHRILSEIIQTKTFELDDHFRVERKGVEIQNMKWCIATYLNDPRRKVRGNEANPAHIAFYENGLYDSEEHKFYPEEFKKEYVVTSRRPFKFFQGTVTREDIKRIVGFLDDMYSPEVKEFLIKYSAHVRFRDPTGWALFVVGEGSNGKSTIMHIQSWLLGSQEKFDHPDLRNNGVKVNLNCGPILGATSNIPLPKLHDENKVRLILMTSYNVAHENNGIPSEKSLEVFKLLSTGEGVTFKQLYVDTNTGLFRGNQGYACNQLPQWVNSDAYYRRVVAIPHGKFHFVEEEGDIEHEGERVIDRTLWYDIVNEIPKYDKYLLDCVKNGEIKLGDIPIPQELTDYKKANLVTSAHAVIDWLEIHTLSEEEGGEWTGWLLFKHFWDEHLSSYMGNLGVGISMEECRIKIVECIGMGSVKWKKVLKTQKRSGKPKEFKVCLNPNNEYGPNF